MIEAGDNRISICLRLIEPLNWLLKVPSDNPESVNKGLLNLIGQRFREVRAVIKKYENSNKNDDRILHIKELFDKAEKTQQCLIDSYSE